MLGLPSIDARAFAATFCGPLEPDALGGVAVGERLCLWLAKDGEGVAFSFDSNGSAGAASTAVPFAPSAPALVNCQTIK